MLVTQSALVMSSIGIDRCGPLMTVVVPWAILQISPKPARTRREVRRVVTGPRNDIQTITRYLSATPQNQERRGRRPR